MKHGISKSYALHQLQNIQLQTLADAYAQLRQLLPSLVRSDDFQLDSQYLQTRIKSEGEEFLTVNLPNLGEWHDRFLLSEDIEVPHGFKTVGGLPKLFRPFWVYYAKVLRPALEDADTSDVISPAQAELVRTMRTLLLGLKKLYPANSMLVETEE